MFRLAQSLADRGTTAHNVVGFRGIDCLGSMGQGFKVKALWFLLSIYD